MDPMNPLEPQNGTKVPPPPTPEVAVRTMQSDNQSLEQGQITPQPQVVSPTNFDASQSFAPETNNQLDGQVEPAQKKSHLILWVVIGIVGLVGLGLIGYFVIYPLISGGDAVVAPIEEPIAQPTLPEAPAAPVAETSDLLTHTSAFVVAPAATVTVQIPEVTTAAIKAALVAQGDSLSNQALGEVVFSDAENAQLAFTDVLSALLPEFLDANQANTWLADDFTGFVYKEGTGVWPGYIVNLKEGINNDTFAQWLASLEATNLSGLFVSDPGTLAAFKNGEVSGISDRYAAGQNGASLGYAIVGGNKLLISTSFNGMKEAIRLLGL